MSLHSTVYLPFEHQSELRQWQHWNLLCTNYNNIRKQYIYPKTIVRVSTASNIVMDIPSLSESILLL